MYNSDWFDPPSDSLFAVAKPVIKLSQWFALFPTLSNLNGGSGAYNTWRTWRVIYALGSILACLGVVLCNLVLAFKEMISYFDIFSPMFFYSMALLTQSFLLLLSDRWLQLCCDFRRVERQFGRHGALNISRKIQVIAVILLLGAAVEHGAGIVQSVMRTLPCSADSSDFFYKIHIFLNSNYKIFRLINYKPWLGGCVMAVSLLCTFHWNFLDLLLAIVAMILSARLRQFNAYLLRHQWQEKNRAFWRQVRDDYRLIASLVHTVDNCLGQLVAISFFNNIVIICQQLLRGIQPKRNLFQRFYFGWSLGFLLLRALFSAWSMTEVHDLSKRSRHVLYCVPPQSYCRDVRRLVQQMENDSVMLKGWGLFPATRRTLLAIAGTIITYEMILLQFNVPLDYDTWKNVSNVTSSSFCATLST